MDFQPGNTIPDSPPNANTQNFPNQNREKPFSKDLVSRAMEGDQQALSEMFLTVLPDDEKIIHADYLGILGIWILGTKSFGCVTTKRVASIQIAPFGEKVYQDGELDMLNSSKITQPSKLPLYLSAAAHIVIFAVIILSLLELEAWLAVLIFLGLTPLFALSWFITVKIYYRTFKCGLELFIREGKSLYLFINRGKILKAHAFYRIVTQYRTWNKEKKRNIVLTRSE